jgi:hypothetical protein
MKELTLSRIFPKKEKRLTQLAVNINGIWSFAGLGNPTRVVNNLSIYKISYDFGLLFEGTTSPDNPPVRGSKGDYIFVDSAGSIKLSKPDMYNRMFPPTNINPPIKNLNSKVLANPNYIDQVIKNSKDVVYNTPMGRMPESVNRPIQSPCNCDKPTTTKPCNCN